MLGNKGDISARTSCNLRFRSGSEMEFVKNSIGQLLANHCDCHGEVEKSNNVNYIFILTLCSIIPCQARDDNFKLNLGNLSAIHFLKI